LIRELSKGAQGSFATRGYIHSESTRKEAKGEIERTPRLFRAWLVRSLAPKKGGAMNTTLNRGSEIPEPNITRFLFADRRMAPVWLVLRVYLGYLWLAEGIGKIMEGGWIGAGAGGAVKGFAQGALQQTGGEYPQVTGWYAGYLENVVIPNAALFSYIVTLGEILVGLGLIVGLFTGIAAFFGGFMNASFIFAGTAGANPLMFILAILLMLAWRVAGYWGLDRWALPAIGVPGYPGTAFRTRRSGGIGPRPRVP
jgi:thiosulfate dehydrogenase (quinone) large subunit